MSPASPYNLANLLSLLRLVLVPVFVALFQSGKDSWATAVFIVAALTDLLDGYLARRYRWVTQLGTFIDPLADKALTLSAWVLLYMRGSVPFWAVTLAFSRELVVVTGFVLLAVLEKQRTLKVSFWGKAATMAVMFFLGFLLASKPLEWPSNMVLGLRWGICGAAIFSFLSGLDYAARAAHDFGRARKRPSA